MAKFRLIAIDIDGTLLAPDGSISARNRQAIHHAVEAGYDVIFATGRNVTECRRILDTVGHRDMGVFVSGAIVMDLRQNRVLFRIGMDPGLARQVSGAIEALGHAALALQDSADADYLATSDVPLDEATRHWMQVTSARIVRVGRLAQHPHPSTLRVGLVAATVEAERIEKLLVEQLGDRVIVHSLFVPSYDVQVVEVFEPGVSKWNGVLWIAQQRGITAAEIVAVGDDVNDISMIRGAGLGVAMGNAKPAVIAAATRVLRTNTQDGLADLLEELAGRKEHPPAPRVSRCGS